MSSSLEGAIEVSTSYCNSKTKLYLKNLDNLNPRKHSFLPICACFSTWIQESSHYPGHRQTDTLLYGFACACAPRHKKVLLNHDCMVYVCVHTHEFTQENIAIMKTSETSVPMLKVRHPKPMPSLLAKIFYTQYNQEQTSISTPIKETVRMATHVQSTMTLTVLCQRISWFSTITWSARVRKQQQLTETLCHIYVPCIHISCSYIRHFSLYF